MTTVIFAFAMAWEEAEETGADAASCAEQPVSIPKNDRHKSKVAHFFACMAFSP